MRSTSSRLGKALVAGGLLAGASAAYAGPFSANVALTTDYVWRYVSQTLEDPAVQGGFDFNHEESGVFLGVWGSNVDFGGPEHMELDVYGGWGTEFKNGVGLELGAISYNYFDDTADIDFWELYGTVSYKWVSVEVYYDPDNENTFVQAGLDFELPQDFGLALSVGNYKFDLDLAPGIDSYTGWSVGLSKEWGGFGFDLSYYDTDSDAETAFGNVADGRVVFTVSKEF